MTVTRFTISCIHMSNVYAKICVSKLSMTVGSNEIKFEIMNKPSEINKAFSNLIATIGLELRLTRFSEKHVLGVKGV